MNPITTSLVVAAAIFASAMAGLVLHSRLPSHHLTKETQDVVRLGTGMLSVLASLVLGLLIATAKTSYDTTDQAIRGYATELVLLDETFRDYGDTAAVPRNLLRQYTTQLLADFWPKDGSRPAVLDSQMTGAMLEHIREAIRALRPVDEGQTWLQNQALQISTNLLRQRWLMIEQAGTKIQPMVVVVLVLWIAFIFATFALNAPRNATVVAAFLVCSLAIGGSIYLILEMDSPLNGTMKLSDWPVTNALAHMQP
ncbi:MAG: hypothetical protein BGP12_10700 [Rhodospirillales bacterium 70-18]|nr:MAG: hypothetical protein BGP12_10700 [Rhodospirillales bacterium 70-18]